MRHSHRFAFVTLVGVMACSDGVAARRGTELANVTLSPRQVEVRFGEFTDFTATGTWSDGRTNGVDVDFTATGGSITATGRYVAGTVAGEFRVVGAHQASGLADTAAVSVSAPLPPGGSILLQEGFEDNDAAARGWYDNVSWTTTTAQHRSTGTRSLAWSWAAGAVLPTFGSAARHAFAPTTQVYLSYWIKYSDNWLGSGVAYHPHEFQLLTNASGAFTGPAFTRLTTYIEHSYTTGGGVPRIGTTDGENIAVAQVGQDLSAVTEQRATSGCNGNTDGLVTECYEAGGGQYRNGKWLHPAGNAPAFLPDAGPGYKGNWRHVEAFFQMNTIVNGIGQTDGVARYWLDGALLIDRQNILFRTGAQPNLQWNQLLLGPYIGVGSPVAQTAWIDDLVIATARP